MDVPRREFAGAALFRVRGRSLRVVPDHNLRDAAPDAFTAVAGVVVLDGRRWILEQAPHGKRNAAARENALLCWRLHTAGFTPRELTRDELIASPAGVSLLQVPRPGTPEQLARALVLLPSLVGERRTTALGRAGTLAEVIAALVGAGAPRAMLRRCLHPLPDHSAWESWAALAMARAKAGRPQVLPVADIAQGQALRSMLCRMAKADGEAWGDGDILRLRGLRPGMLIRGPQTPDEAERGLRQLPTAPTLVIVPGAYLDLSRTLGALAEVAPPPGLTPPGLLEWLKPLGLESTLLVEKLIPALLHDTANAQRTVQALCDRCEVMPPGPRPTLQPGWESELQHMQDRRGTARLVHPTGARVAVLLAASPDGLDAAGVDVRPELARGAAMLRDAGLAVLEPVEGRNLLRFAPGSRPDARAARADFLWLAERAQLCPWPADARREAWSLGLRLRAGELEAWHGTGDKLLRALLEHRHYTLAAQLLETHAVAAARRGAGPPGVETVLLASELMPAVTSPRRMRRLLHGWLARYDGELRPLVLAVLGRAERMLHGQAGYSPVLASAKAALAHGSVSRAVAQSAWIEIASCYAADDDRGAQEALEHVRAPYAQAGKLLMEARVLLVRAQCEFIRIRLPEALTHLQQARDCLHERANQFLRVRIEGQIEAYTALYTGVDGRFRRGSDALLQPLRELHDRHDCLGDLLAATIVNDNLFRMRSGEVGGTTQENVEGVLASARPDNLRGYLIVLYQLAENALYRGELEALRLINARMAALNPGGTGNALVHASWLRHEALRMALAGNWREALAFQRSAHVHHLPPPFGPRSAMLRRGELGLLMLFAGKFRNAARLLWGAGVRLAGMSAGGRASPYALPCLLAKLLAGEAPGAEMHESMDGYVRGGYVLARCVQAVVARPAVAADEFGTLDAPPAWKALVALAGAIVARRERRPEAHALAQVARRELGPGFGRLRTLLDNEFPGLTRGKSVMPPAVLQALGELALLPADCTAEALAQQFAEAISRAFNTGAAALLRVPESAAASQGATPADWRFALAQACDLGELRQDGLYALGLDGALGAVGVCNSDVQAGELEAFAIRLSQVLEQRRDRASALSERRRQHELAAAGFALASAGSAAADKLHALASLVRAMGGASQLELVVLRGHTPMLATGQVHRATHELQSPMDASLSLRLRATGGDREALQAGLEAAATAFATVLRAEGERLRGGILRAEDGEDVYVGEALLGASPAAHKLYQELRRYADLELPVVISGESGSGKDLAAKGLHLLSSRAGLPHVVVDCPTLRRETAASELFGHVAGAFTGATTDHAGMLERAGRGTLQLDAPGELHPGIQPMLLRALQERSFLPVGALREREFRGRLVITTIKPLPQLVADGRLREDLAQRLAGLSIELPLLRDRGDDALAIARSYLREQSRALGRELRLSPRAEAVIAAAAWPGNVRELRHTIMRAAVLADGAVVDALEPEAASYAVNSVLAPETGLRTHARLILGALRAAGESAPRMIAGKLGLSRTTVSITLAELTRQGYARRVGNGRSTRYVANGGRERD